MSSIDKLMHLSQNLKFLHKSIWERDISHLEMPIATNEIVTYDLVTNVNSLNTTLLEKNAKSSVTWRLFNIDIDIIFYSLLFALFLFIIAFCITFKVCHYFQAGKSYEVAKTEAMDMKRQLHRVSKWVADSETTAELN